LITASKLLAEQYQSVLEEIEPAVSEGVFARLKESIRCHQELRCPAALWPKAAITP
jgi:hypothetical protein